MSGEPLDIEKLTPTQAFGAGVSLALRGAEGAVREMIEILEDTDIPLGVRAATIYHALSYWASEKGSGRVVVTAVALAAKLGISPADATEATAVMAQASDELDEERRPKGVVTT
jgi:hypothetical protein